MAFDISKHRQDSLELYRTQRPQYEQLAEAVRGILRASIPASCPIHSIEARAKGIDQFVNKACKLIEAEALEPKYPFPMKQITDLAGVRVITFFPRNIDDVCRSIESELEVRERRDKGEELLAENRFGYQSIHYLVTLRATRVMLPEYKRFDGLVAEIQVRTILQHAWAEMEHDIQYKSVAAIPGLIRRRFMSLAGMLEIADREFQAIQDADADLRSEVRQPLDEELTGLDELKVELAPPEKQMETIDAEVAPETREYLRGNVRALLQSGYYGEAVKAYDQVIERYPKVHTNYLGRARARFLAGDTPGALSDLSIASDLFPDDPQIIRLRAQIEGVATTPEEKVTARNEAYLGNNAIASGNPEEALKHYVAAEIHGWSFVYSQFNKAIANCLAKDYAAMREQLSRLKVQRGSVYGVTAAAIQAIAALVSGEAHEALLKDLRSQLDVVPAFSFARSHLRHLEEGLAKLDNEGAQRAAPAFAMLRSHREPT
jgi:ppGpp synthetase/RelA/SpoT-type nucleotidyltranferase